MTGNKPTIINDVQYEDLPFSWIKKLDLDTNNLPDNTRLRVTIEITHPAPKASFQKVLATAHRLQNLPLINPDFSEADLYDEHGVPK